jgi:hypothetical protein
MGTRSATVFIDNEFESPREICVLYRQFDGYCDGHGKELKEFLQGMQIVNGMNGKEGPKFANGGGCLAAQVIGHFKEHSPGQFYVYPPGNRQLYNYILTTKSKEPLRLRVEYVCGETKILYDGPLDAFDPAIAEKDDEDAA